jgi:lipoprotein NlpI
MSINLFARTSIHLSTFLVCFLFFAARNESPAQLDEVETLRETFAKLDAEEFDAAIAILDKLIAQDEKLPVGYYWRGRAHFQAGHIDQSAKDFDRYVELNPERKSSQWERGITLYYAKRFQEGADQFALYQTFHDSDVENSVWRYLCMAQADSVEAAREKMLPIKDDRRVPMMEIYEMYRGNSSPEKVLAKAKSGSDDDERLNRSLFYAHLYIGLFYEANKQPEVADKHLAQAVEHKVEHYMWNVADIHQKLKKTEQDE